MLSAELLLIESSDVRVISEGPISRDQYLLWASRKRGAFASHLKSKKMKLGCLQETGSGFNVV